MGMTPNRETPMQQSPAHNPAALLCTTREHITIDALSGSKHPMNGQLQRFYVTRNGRRIWREAVNSGQRTCCI
jgi:hypothetical protein